MENVRGVPIHGEAILDGDASGGIATLLYPMPGGAARTLGSDEYLHITDLTVANETGGDTWYDVDADGDDDHDVGEVIFSAMMDAKDFIHIQFVTPFICPKGKVPKLYGAANNRNVATIQGFITQS